MSEFILLNQALEKLQNTKKSKAPLLKGLKDLKDPKGPKGSKISGVKPHEEYEYEYECEHENIISEKGVSVCVDCGEELYQKIVADKDWRYYGQVDSKTGIDASRIQNRKVEERNIFRDVENLGFSQSIIAEANKIYSQVTAGQIYRGNSRKAIVFACVFHAFKQSGMPQSHEKLIQIFNLSRKFGLQGLKHVNLHAPKKLNTTSYITPAHIIEEILEKFNASKEQKNEVLELYKKIKNRSSKLNRSRPQSVASGLVFYWICLKKKDITLKEFGKKVGLSELTINKIAKEIAQVLQTPDIV